MSVLGKIAGSLQFIGKQPVKAAKAIGGGLEDHTDRRLKEGTAIVITEAVPLLVQAVSDIAEKLDKDDRLQGLGEDLLAALAEASADYELSIQLRKRMK